MTYSILAYGIPILLAAIGGYLTDISGKMNIALEGLIMVGAFTAYGVMAATSSYLLAFTAAALVPALISAGYETLTTVYHGNIFVTGLAVNLLLPGLTALLSVRIYASSGVLSLQTDHMLSSVTLLQIITVITLIVFVTAYGILHQTKAGLLLRAAGLNRRAFEIRGGSPDAVQRTAFALSGLLCGLSGAYLTLSLHAFVPNISSGKGWLALAAIYLGDRRLSGLVYAALFFSVAEYAANRAQGLFDMPASLFLGFPFLITFLGLFVKAMFRSRRNDHKKP
ncbi:MAG: ABC transporter permease [Spirochaetia bacterium]|nr:ABC transporter permease [Spirochaetia bacterium]MCF7941754.1 ABC transporter permease [Spirochaetia bacterium]